VDLVQSTCVIDLVLEASDRFKDSISMTSALRRWSLGAHTRRLSNYHQQRQANSDKGAATTARQWLTLVAIVIVRWSKDLDAIFSMFGVSNDSGALMTRSSSNKDGNVQGMGRVDQYHTHTHIVNGYKILPIPVTMGMKLYPYPYPAGTVGQLITRLHKAHALTASYLYDRVSRDDPGLPNHVLLQIAHAVHYVHLAHSVVI
jgi:hypothetical protein